ncbi:hypothetical protein OKW34_006828 [Paraburkholderia youngii]
MFAQYGPAGEDAVRPRSDRWSVTLRGVRLGPRKELRLATWSRGAPLSRHGRIRNLCSSLLHNCRGSTFAPCSTRSKISRVGTGRPPKRSGTAGRAACWSYRSRRPRAQAMRATAERLPPPQSDLARDALKDPYCVSFLLKDASLTLTRLAAVPVRVTALPVRGSDGQRTSTNGELPFKSSASTQGHRRLAYASELHYIDREGFRRPSNTCFADTAARRRRHSRRHRCGLICRETPWPLSTGCGS